MWTCGWEVNDSVVKGVNKTVNECYRQNCWMVR
jgi:hypothetical protein